MPFKTGEWGEQAKARSARRKEYFKAYQKRRYVEKREEILRAHRQWAIDNPEKLKAQELARRHVDIPEGQLCEKCNERFATQRHHPDYAKPLEVKFLCAGCHSWLNFHGQKGD